MAISQDTVIDTLPWAGYTDPALPMGSWIFFGSVAGDASGGNMTVNMVFHLATPQRNPLMYNLEQVYMRMGGNADNDMQAFTENLGHLTPGRPLLTTGFGAVLSARASAAMGDMAMLLRPIWLGAPNLPGGRSSIQWSVLNVLADSLVVTAYGYFWGPRSLRADGGPQRPSGTPFGI